MSPQAQEKRWGNRRQEDSVLDALNNLDDHNRFPYTEALQAISNPVVVRALMWEAVDNYDRKKKC